ncbi:tyrosine-type recombinase/integrase [Metamycoplasma buccale]|uniref:tyrosine-type recombinase/integrase n=1 Tax=Metamycoplasma buccale TaxID=55602 RepID=UPI00398EBE0D
MKNIDQLKIFYAEFQRLIETNNRSAVTLERYKLILNKLTDWNTVDELLDQINFLLTQAKTCQNTLFTQRAVFKTFCEWLSKRNQIYIPFNNRIIKYKLKRGTRRSYTTSELMLLLDELKEFKNKKFEIIFKIILATGIRVSEWSHIDFKELIKNDFQMIISTAKNNNDRPFRIPENNHPLEYFRNIRSEIIKGIDLNVTSKTIKNLFCSFKKFVIKKHPEFEAKISAHILRHHFATSAMKNLKDVSEVSKILGHVNSNTTASTYITYDSNYANERLKVAQMPIMDSLNILELQNKQKINLDKIATLEKNNKDLKNEIDRLKNIISTTIEIDLTKHIN